MFLAVKDANETLFKQHSELSWKHFQFLLSLSRHTNSISDFNPARAMRQPPFIVALAFLLSCTFYFAYCIDMASAAQPLPNETPSVRQISGHSCQSMLIDFSLPGALDEFSVDWCPQNVYQTNTSLAWRLTPECGTTLVFPHTFQYGNIEGRIRVAAGSGVVSTILLAGPAPSDELDWEWVGKDTHTAQSMYFVNGQRVDPNSQNFPLPESANLDMSADFHNYAIEVKADNITWFIDSNPVRTLARTNGVPFPSNAGQARMGIWDGSQSSAWAGTVDWNSGPFIAEIAWFKFTPYC